MAVVASNVARETILTAPQIARASARRSLRRHSHTRVWIHPTHSHGHRDGVHAARSAGPAHRIRQPNRSGLLEEDGSAQASRGAAMASVLDVETDKSAMAPLTAAIEPQTPSAA